MSKQQTIAWSYSRLTAFETCPRRFHITQVTKLVVEPQTEATIHGNEVHKALENYVGGAAPLPEKYEPYRAVADKIIAAPGKKLLEYRFGLTRGLRPTDFFAKDCWVRGVLDVAVVNPKTVVVLDYKTGKRKADHDQLGLFAMAGTVLWPFAEKIKTGYIWLQSGQMDTKEYTQDDRVPLAQEFAARAQRLEDAFAKDNWPARPSGLCGWCPVGTQNCEHWRGNHGSRG